MRRAVNAVTGALVLTLVAALFFSAVRNWLDPKPVTLTSPDGRPMVSVVQPKLRAFDRAIDNSGYDVSYPQCRKKLPTASVGFAIVGLNNGKPFTVNPCFAKQWKWATTHSGAAVYINTADPKKGSAAAYGNKIARDSLRRLHSLRVPAGTPVWLDIESANSWTDSSRSLQVINAIAAGLARDGYPVGVYAAPIHWFEITLNAVVGVPAWVALGRYDTVAAGVIDAKAACGAVAFGDRTPSIVQFTVGRLDHNLMCPVDATGLVAPQR